MRHASCVCTHLQNLLFSFWQYICLMVSCIICRNLILPWLKQDVFFKNSYFSSTRSVLVAIKWASFTFLLLFFRKKVSQSTFIYSQIESHDLLFLLVCYFSLKKFSAPSAENKEQTTGLILMLFLLILSYSFSNFLTKTQILRTTHRSCS